jgi:uncharacterized protein (DUF2147 family)
MYFDGCDHGNSQRLQGVQKGLMLQVPGDEAMLLLKPSLLLAGCAAVAVGVVGGWAVLTFSPTGTSSFEAPGRTISSEPLPILQPPADKSSADQPALAQPSPPASAKEPTRDRNATASGPTGVWIDHTGRGAVEITDCSGALCGRIVWLKDARNKSVCGKQIIGSARRSSVGTWDGGWIYDPDRDTRYSVELKLLDPNKLRVMGYMGSKLFSETYTWKRASADLERCDAVPAVASPSPGPNNPNPAASEITKAEPSAEPPETKPKAVKPTIADLEKFAREMVKGKAGGKECTVKLPYVGTVNVPCPG